MPSLPTVLIVGGSDVDARLEMMHCLEAAFEFSALGSDPALHDRFRAAGFGYGSYALSRQANPISDLRTVSELMRAFRHARPMIVHTFDTKPGVWGRLAARWAGVPVVIGTLPGLGSLYASDGLKTRTIRWVYQWLQTWACRLSDLTVFQNTDDAHQFVASGVVPRDKARVILGSGVSTERFSLDRVSEADKRRARAELGLRPDKTVVTMVARVIRSKGVLEYLTAAQEVSASRPDAGFLLVGAHDEESIDRLTPAELTQLRQTVIWPGPRPDIPAVLAVSDILVLPSVYREGIPRVLLEGASMGLPIVTTDTPGCNEIVENGVNGFLVPVRDPEALSKAVLHLIDHPELRRRFGRASRQRAVAHFDLSVIADQTASVYRQLLQRER